MTSDFMTGVPATPGKEIAVPVLNTMVADVMKVAGITRVMYDLTAKPPGAWCDAAVTQRCAQSHRNPHSHCAQKQTRKRTLPGGGKGSLGIFLKKEKIQI